MSQGRSARVRLNDSSVACSSAARLNVQMMTEAVDAGRLSIGRLRAKRVHSSHGTRIADEAEPAGSMKRPLAGQRPTPTIGSIRSAACR
jgi:hypothetical protein